MGAGIETEPRRRRQEPTTRVTASFATGAPELYATVAPGSPSEPAEDLYERLSATLAQRDADLGRVVRERIYLADAAADFETLRSARERAYARAGVEPPPATWLQQPPCDPAARFVTQAHALLPSTSADVRFRAIEGLPGPATGCVVSTGSIERIYLCNLTGEPGAPFPDQAAQMFERADDALGALGIGFRDVVRTWICLPDIDRDYDAFNAIRNEFFERRGVGRIPASTGVQGGTHSVGYEALLDLVAIAPSPDVDLETMHAPTMNEAYSYGSSFSRGMLVRTPASTLTYVSGTASIDDTGEVVGVGDIRQQLHRMLDNVSTLLHEAGLDWSDALRATTYLKQCSYDRDLEAVWRERGLPDDLPMAVCRADICRPEWLCEIEVTAARPRAESP